MSGGNESGHHDRSFPGSRPINVKKTGRRLIRLSAGGASVTGHARLIPVSVGYLR